MNMQHVGFHCLCTNARTGMLPKKEKRKDNKKKIAAHAVFDFLNAAKKSLKVMDLYFNRSNWVLCLY